MRLQGFVLLLIVFWSSRSVAQVNDTIRFVAYAKVTHPPIAEMSGIVPSGRYPGTYWVLNDSGNEPYIFAIDSAGHAIMPPWMDDYYVDDSIAGKQPYPGVKIDLAANNDWEEITRDGDDLYIMDLGNNGNARRDLGIYVVTEPNPRAIDRTRIAKWIPVAYDDQLAYPPANWQYDCEAAFVYQHKIYVITKHRANGQYDKPDVSGNLYRLDEMRAEQTNVLRKIGGKLDFGGWVCGAAMSPDEKTLAVLCNYPTASVWLFEAPKSGDNFFASRARRFIFKGGKQAEAICFRNNDTIIITNEQREMFEIGVSAFHDVTR
jgi:hypothetical protein